jgi:hypothetical protein
MNETKYPCPVCKVNLHWEFGEQIHPGNPEYGVMVFCRNKECRAEEVMGHGKNEKEAFEIVTDRFKNLV